MDRNDREAIEGLFDKLTAAERQAPPRDTEAEALIRDRIAAQPAAPYFMAQTIVVLEAALAEAKARQQTLEAEAGRGGSRGFLGGLFGDDAARGAPEERPAQRRGGPWGGAPAGGGFLAGAAQTAVGVAGGVLIGSAIAGMFGSAGAEEALPQEPQEDPGADLGDAGGFDDLDI